MLNSIMSAKERMDFRRILCPIGLTPDSDQALRYGIALARAYNAKLFVLHCTGAYATASSTNVCNIQDSLEDLIKKHLHLPAASGLDARVIVAEGDPSVEIAREAAARQIDLIVMHSRRRPLTAALLGSTAETLCRTAPAPVLITHTPEHEWAGATSNEISLQRVLVAHDFSTDSELALSYGLLLAKEFQAELHLLHVLPTRAKSRAPEIDMLPANAVISFDEAADRLQRSIPKETYAQCKVKHILYEGEPYRRVLNYSEDQSIDLICMGASGTGFGAHSLFGSNSDRVLRQAPCPVLIARPLKPLIVSVDAASA